MTRDNPSSNISSDIITTALYSHYISRFLVTITGIRGVNSNRCSINLLVKLIGCNKVKTMTYYPASNGMIEHWHRSLKIAISWHN